MPLASMTGFARSDGAADGLRWTWELRSVNGKGLDLRLRLPPGYERLEPPVRERAAARLTRGNVQATLSLETGAGGQRFRINEDVLAEVIAAMERIGGRIDVQPPTLDGILSIRGVIEVEDGAAGRRRPRRWPTRQFSPGSTPRSPISSSCAPREGAAIGAVLSARLDEIERLVRAAEASPARSPAAIRAKLAEQIAALLDAAPALDPDRLHQEAVLLATKADIREEIDRLDAHIAAARASARRGRTGRPAPRFPRPGVQPRGQYALRQVE